MEAKVIALSHICIELLPKMNMIAVLGKAIGLPKDLATMHVLFCKMLDHWFWQRCHHLSTHHAVSIMLLRPFGFMKR